LMFPAGLFAVVLFTLPSIRKYQQQIAMSAPAYVVGGLTVLGMLGGMYGMFIPHPTVEASGQELPLVPVAPNKQQVNWDHYGGDTGVAGLAHLVKFTVIKYSKLRKPSVFGTEIRPTA